MLPQFPFPSWLDGAAGALPLMALIGWAAFAVLAVVGAVQLVREVRRRRRVALADAVAERRAVEAGGSSRGRAPRSSDR